MHSTALAFLCCALPFLGAIAVETTTNTTGIVSPKCKGELSCAGRCMYKMDFQNTRSKLSCFCDPLCDSVFQDCCADYDQECNATWMKERFPENDLDTRWECSSTYGVQGDKIWMIGSCGPDWRDDELWKKCTEHGKSPAVSLHIPVISQNNITFRNRYCALCNTVKVFTQWQYDVPCDVIPSTNYTELESIAFLDSFCSAASLALIIEKQLLFRYCYVISTKCRYEDDEDAVEGCQTGPTGLVGYPWRDNYRNVDCLRCNSLVSNGELTLTPRCGPTITPKAMSSPSFFDSFSFIFKGSQLRVRRSRCPDGHIFDRVSRDCKKVLGRQDIIRENPKFQRYSVLLSYEEKNNSCRESIMNGGRERNRLRFSYVFQKLLDISFIERGWYFADMNIQILGNSSYFLSFQVLGKKDADKTNLDTPLQFSKIDKIVFHSKLVQHKTGHGICKYSLTYTAVRAMFCSGNNTYAINEDDFSRNGTMFLNETQQYYHRGQYLVYDEQNETRLAVCKDFRPANCSYYLDVKNRTSWKMFPNRSIYSDVTMSLFDYGEYSIIDDTLWLCLTKDLRTTADEIWRNPSSIHRDILSYATLVAFIISIISLVVLLVVYSVFPSLRNLPGKNLMLLCVVLALGQLLWLMQSGVSSSSNVCIVMSVALQYFFLSTFSCSSSIAFHSFITFHRIARGKISQSSSNKTVFWYAMYGLGFPLVVVTVFWLLDFYEVISLVYVGELCWFADRHSLYIAFIAPVFTILSINIILLLATLRLIYKCTKETQKIVENNGGPSKNHVGIYLRMSTLKGLTWLFGIFLIVFPKVLAFDYLFVITNGLQGFYIAVAFLFTDSVKKKISRKLYRSSAASSCSRLNSSGTKYIG